MLETFIKLLLKQAIELALLLVMVRLVHYRLAHSELTIELVTD